MSHPLRFESKKGRICVAWVWNREGTEKLVNGKQYSVWFVPTGMKGIPQNVLLNFRLEFPKRGLTIYLPSGISEIFCQMVSTPSAFRQTKVTFVYACSNYSQVSRVFVLFTIWSLEPPLLLSKSLKRTGENAFVQSLYKRILVSGNKQIWTAEINHPNFEEGLSFNRSSVSQVKDFNIKTNSMWRQKSMFHVLYGIFSVDKALLVDT